MKNWLARKKHVVELQAELSGMRDRLKMRSALIHDQDDEITRLRRELKECQTIKNAFESRLMLSLEKQKDAENAAEYWQGKAANP